MPKVPLVVVLRVAVGLALSIVGTWYVYPVLDPSEHRSISGAYSLLRGVLLYAAMLFGMLGVSWYDALEGPPEETIDPQWSRAFVRSAIVSPIIFFAVYKIAQDQPDGAVALLLAFQNGFFWKTILERRAPRG